VQKFIRKFNALLVDLVAEGVVCGQNVENADKKSVLSLTRKAFCVLNTK
jgi:hypothetical protein